MHSMSKTSIICLHADAGQRRVRFALVENEESSISNTAGEDPTNNCAVQCLDHSVGLVQW